MSISTEDSGSHCEYYHCPVTHPQNPNQAEPYIANCEDIIQALGLTFDEGCEFKSIWRRGRGRQGFKKAESTALRDAIKAVHYAGRVLALEERRFASGNIDTTSVDTQRAALYDWRTVPAKFNWLATDPSGSVYAYMLKPRVSQMADYGWNYDGTDGFPQHKRMQGISAAHGAWQNSLEARP
jgi:hypothetical protein